MAKLSCSENCTGGRELLGGREDYFFRGMKIVLPWDEIILQRTHFKFSVFIIFHSFFAVVQ